MFKRLIAWLKKLFGFASVAPVETPVEATPESYPGSLDENGNFFSGYVESEADEEAVREFKAAGKRTILPPSVDLRGKLGPVDQQGNTNACVSHAITTALEGSLGVSNQSRLFVYWNARVLAAQQTRDAGCTPRNAIRGIMANGSADETVWPYDISRLLVQPSADVFSAAGALKTKIKTYQSVTSLAALKTALAQGLPVAFGMTVPDTFVSITKYTGELPLPTSTTKWIGAHAMVAVGYDDTKGAVLVRNSFGPLWGSQGHCWMPYGWFTTMTTGSRVSDAWAFIAA